MQNETIQETEAQKQYRLYEKVENYFKGDSALAHPSINVTFRDGRVEKRRLFFKDSRVYYFKKGSSRRGYSLLNDMPYISGIEFKKESIKLPSIQWEDSLLKMKRILEESGLWPEMIPRIEAFYSVGYHRIQECYKISTDWSMDPLLRREKLKAFEPRIADHADEYLWHFAGPVKIKKMNFGTYLNDSKLLEIKKAMEEKKALEVDGSTSYDVSFNYDGKTSAWYSEEYRGCGNGHYYLAINSTHAVFWEDD